MTDLLSDLLSYCRERERVFASLHGPAVARHGGDRRAVGLVADDPVVLERLHDAAGDGADTRLIARDRALVQAHERIDATRLNRGPDIVDEFGIPDGEIDD